MENGNPGNNKRTGSPGESVALRDAGAFGDAARRSYGAVYLTALAVVRDRDTAEDIAQEAFLRAWLRIDMLRDVDLFQPWLGRITRTLATQWLRTGQQRSRVLPLISLEEIMVDPVDERGDDPRQAAGRTEEQGQLSEAVMALPEEMRQAVLLHYVEEMSPSDIARLNGEAASTVTRRLERARQMLRQHLESGLAANLQSLRPGGRSLERSLGLIAAAVALPAASRAQLLQLVSDTPPPPAIDTVTSAGTAAHLKEGGIMNGIIAKAGAGKLVLAGAAAAAIVAGGAQAVRYLSDDKVSPAANGSKYNGAAGTSETVVRRVRSVETPSAQSIERGSNAVAGVSSNGGRKRLTAAERIALLKNDLISTQAELVLQPGETTGVLHLNLQVVDESGLPVEGATVRVPEYGFKPGDFTTSFQRPEAEVSDYLTNGKGIARVSVPAGEAGPFKTTRLTAEASHPEYAATRAEMDFTSITKMVLSAGATLEIQAVNGETSAPLLSNVTPEFGSHFEPDWYVRPDGTVAVRKLVGPKIEFYLQHINAAGERLVSDVQTVELPYEDDAPLRIALHPTVTVTGSLDPVVPRPVQDVQLHTSYHLSRQSALGFTTGTVFVESDGSFKIPDVPVGKTLIVAAKGDGYYSRPGAGSRSGRRGGHFDYPLQVVAGNQEHVVPMAKAASAVVRLKDSDGNPVTSATVRFKVTYGGLMKSIPYGGIRTDLQGVAVIEDVPAVDGLSINIAHDEWQLEIREGSRNFGGEKRLDMSAGGTVEHDITLVKKLKVANGKAAQVFVMPEGGTLIYTFPTDKATSSD